MMKGAPVTPKNWKALARHPLSADYEDITGQPGQDLRAGLRACGWLPGQRITLHEGKVLDGWQRQLACVELSITPEYQELPEGILPVDFVVMANDNRRHESQDKIRTRAEERRKRVAQARAEGKSTRAIAEEENVSQQQVLRDLKAPGDTPVSPEPEKVTGKDGKTYSARGSKPKAEPILCARCTRIGAPIKGCPQCKAARDDAKPKTREPGDDTESEAAKRRAARRNGKALFDWKKLEAPFGAFVRAVEEAGTAYGKVSPEYRTLDRLVEQVAREFQDWKKRVLGSK